MIGSIPLGSIARESLEIFLMIECLEQTYRKQVKKRDLVSYNVVVKETDLCVSTDIDLARETKEIIFHYRRQLETYIQDHSDFVSSLKPYPADLNAPKIVRAMIAGTGGLGVGPMASVAGTLAHFVGMQLLEKTDQVIVENGGDIFLKANRDITISILAGNSPFRNTIGLIVNPGQMPIGVCSSSGTAGHSLSFGMADVVCILSASTTLADAAATALGNRVKSEKDLDKIAQWAGKINGIVGGVAVVGEKMAAWGDVQIVKL